MKQDTSTFDKQIVEISKELIDEIAEKIRGYNESFNKRGIIDYIDRRKEKAEKNIYREILDTWADNRKNLTIDKRGRLFYHLFSVAGMISQSTESRWMVFMIQDPEATDMIKVTTTGRNLPLQKYITYPFGMKSELRASWDEELRNEDKITFTDILFGKNIVGNDIYCIRIGDVVGDAKLDELIYVDIIGSFKEDTFEIHDKRIRIKYSPKKEEILSVLYEKLSDKDKVINYVNFMVKHTGFNPVKQRQLIIYAIPVLSTSLYPSCPSRSGLYVVSTKRIEYYKLLFVQNLVSQLLCHIDYLRAAIIQRTEDIRVFTHDLQGSLKYLNSYVTDDNLRRCIEYLNLLIDCLSGNLPLPEINDIAYPLLNKILGAENWLIEASNFSALLEERWIPKVKDSGVKLFTKTNSINLPKLRLDKKYSGAVASLIFVLLKNAWKHQYFFYNEIRANPYIRVDWEKDSEGWMLFIKNNDLGSNHGSYIDEKMNLGKGTFAITQKLITLINEHGRIVNLKDPHPNLIKKEFITWLWLSKEVFQ